MVSKGAEEDIVELWGGGKGRDKQRDKQNSGSFAGTVSLNKHGTDEGFISV